MSKKQRHILKAAVTATTLAAAGTCSLFGQASDPLIDKLVDKGILTVKEANDLREESDTGLSKALQVKNGLPDWVTALKINGDVRGRYEGILLDETSKNSAAANAGNGFFPDRHRFRYRLRLGVVATIKDDFEFGMRLTSSEPYTGGANPGDPISGNTTLTGNGSKKFIYLDQAYGKWSPLHTGLLNGGLTLGKMEMPFSNSDIVWDSDYTPEGIAETLGFQLTDTQSLKLTGGQFALNELDNVAGASRDAYLLGGQARWDAKWTPKWQSTLGVGWYGLLNPRSLELGTAVPNKASGNTRDVGGSLAGHYNPVVLDGALTYTLASFPLYTGAFPIKLAGDYVSNPAIKDGNTGFSAGLTFGKAGKRNTWEVSYRYKYLERDAWFEELVDSDTGAFYGAGYNGSGTGYKSGTNVKGHVVKAGYSPFDAFTLNFAVLMTSLINNPSESANIKSDTVRFQVDANLKF